jgi:alpha-beta hydrolase superfamily lysophospholipase
MVIRNTNFYSDALKISTSIFVPDKYIDGEKRAGIIILQGFTANKEMLLPDFAEKFNKAGYVVLTYDYRGFGASEGAKGEVKPLERVEDTRNAITFLSLQPEVNKDKIGIVGICFGGGVGTYTAAIDKRVKCLAVPGVIGSGKKWLRSVRRLWEWMDFLKVLEEDRNNRVLYGESKHMPVFEIAPPDPEVQRKYGMFQSEYKYGGYEPSLACVEAIINFEPENIADQVSPTPFLIFGAGQDMWANSVEAAESVYAKAKEPKKLVILPECTHFGMVEKGLNRDIVMREMLEWFGSHMPAK